MRASVPPVRDELMRFVAENSTETLSDLSIVLPKIRPVAVNVVCLGPLRRTGIRIREDLRPRRLVRYLASRYQAPLHRLSVPSPQRCPARTVARNLFVVRQHGVAALDVLVVA